MSIDDNFNQDNNNIISQIENLISRFDCRRLETHRKWAEKWANIKDETKEDLRNYFYLISAGTLLPMGEIAPVYFILSSISATCAFSSKIRNFFTFGGYTSLAFYSLGVLSEFVSIVSLSLGIILKNKTLCYLSAYGLSSTIGFCMLVGANYLSRVVNESSNLPTPPPGGNKSKDDELQHTERQRVTVPVENDDNITHYRP